MLLILYYSLKNPLNSESGNKAMSARLKRTLHWENLFEEPSGIRIAAQHHLDHPDCRAHSHDFVEIALIVSGAADHCSAAGKRGLSRGDVIVIRPGGWHGYSSCRALEMYNLLFGTEVLHTELSWALEDPGLGYLLVSGPLAADRQGLLYLRLSEQICAKCETHFGELCGHNRKGPGQWITRIGLLLAILGNMTTELDTEDPRIQRGGLHPAVRHGMMLFEENPGAPWGLDDLAAEVGLGKSQLIRQFKAGTGIPPMTYLARLRGERAAFSLIRSSKPVSDIAREVGWPDPAYFARRFKKHFGMTASEYRERFGE